MMYSSKSKWLLSIILACAAALFLFGAVFAEGEVPETAPPEETMAVETPAVESTAEVETAPESGEVMPEPAVEEAVEPAAEAPAVEPAAVEEEPAAESPQEAPPVEPEETPAEPLADVAEVTAQVEALAESEVTLVDGEGEPLDLASAEAADAFVGGDPWWKVGTKTYMTMFPGGCPAGTLGVTCWESTTPITEALNRIVSMGVLPSDRKLYVEAGTYTETVTVNGTSSILAGLNGLIGVGSGTTLINGNVNLSYNTGGFTLSGFEINGQVYFHDNAGTANLTDLNVHDGASGIRVISHNGPIKLKNVTSSDHDRRGAWLDNTAHAYAGIEVTNSSFNHNTTIFDDSGLDIYSNGVVTINGVTASHNINGNGLSITDAKSVTIKNSVFSNNTIDPDNAAWGFGINIRLDDRIANVTLQNVYANTNENTGIKVVTMGAIKLTDVQVMHNGFGTLGDRDGIFLDNCVDDGSGLCLSTVAKPVSVTRATVDNNGYDGLEIYSKSGVTINSMRAYLNGESGLYINNCNYHASVSGCQGSGSVTILSPKSAGVDGVNYFGYNGDYGAYVYTRGAISVSNFQAEHNDWEGLYLDNNNYGSTAGVKVRSTISGFTNTCSFQNDEGIDINSYGTISISRVECNYNNGEGADLDNDGAVSAKSVTISDSQFTGNSMDGLEITSKGNVTLKNVKAILNGSSGTYHGINIDNSYGFGNVSIKSSSSKTFYDCSYNTGHGIYILTFGSASVGNMNCRNNDQNGIYIENHTSPLIRNITLSRGEFLNNVYGVEIYSRGAIALDSIIANFNGNGGARLDNCILAGECTGIGKLTIKGTSNQFSHNGGYGLWVRSRSLISMTNVDASFNDYNGVTLSNAFSNAIANVIFKTSSSSGENNVSYNGTAGNYTGLYISSNGAVTVQNTTWRNNAANGVYISNPAAGLFKPVKIIRSLAYNNTWTGMAFNTNSPVTILDSSANWNVDYGVSLTTEGNVYIGCSGTKYTCSFSDNITDAGVFVYTQGKITINRVTANSNGDATNDHGLDLESTAGNITISRVIANGNDGHGLYAQTIANITLNTMTAKNNYYGARLLNTTGTGNVLVYGSNLFDSNNYGLRIESNGNISVSRVVVEDSTFGNGMYIYGYTLGKTVTLNNITSRYNVGHGIYISAHGNITLNLVNCIQNGTSGNDNDGLYIFQPDGYVITIKNSNFLFNMGNGIQANVLDPNDLTKFKLVYVNYFGNDADNDGQTDLYLY